MNNTLVIKSSIREEGNSSKIVDQLVRRWSEENPLHHIVHRDLRQTPVPHLSEGAYVTMPVAAGERTGRQQSELHLSDELTEEFLAADTLIMGVPMYNLGVPSGFKAYIDHIARPGMTFRYTQKGPVGLAGDKRVIIVLARGGIYWSTANDTQTPYLKSILGFLGMTDITFVVAEGLNISPEKYAEGMATATAEIESLFS